MKAWIKSFISSLFIPEKPSQEFLQLFSIDGNSVKFLTTSSQLDRTNFCPLDYTINKLCISKTALQNLVYVKGLLHCATFEQQMGNG